MSVAREHIPSFMRGIEPRQGEYQGDLASLLKIAWVRAWIYRPGFQRFSVSGSELVAEMLAEVPFARYVVATLEEVPAELPRCEP